MLSHKELVMKLELIIKDSGSRKGGSPSLFKGEDGTLYIQGYMVDAEIGKAANVPAGESIVKISKTFLQDILDQYQTK